MKRQLKAWQVAFTYMGAIIGAGFASGQEILQFFVSYSWFGVGAIIIAVLILGIIGALTIRICRKQAIKSYRQFLDCLLGKRLGGFFDMIISLSLLLGLATMMAGSIAVFKEYLGIPVFWAVMINTLCLFLSLLGKEQGITWLNSLLIPLLVVITGLVIAVSLTIAENVLLSATSLNTGFKFNWVAAGVLYGSYNIVLGTVVLCSLGAKEEKGAVLGSLAIGCLILGIYLVMLRFQTRLFEMEIPMLYLAGLKFYWLRFLYVLVLWFSMLTTAAANAFGLASKVSDDKQKYTIQLLKIILISIPISLAGFSTLVGHFYPLLGMIGLPLLLAIIIKGNIT